MGGGAVFFRNHAQAATDPFLLSLEGALSLELGHVTKDRDFVQVEVLGDFFEGRADAVLC